MHALAWLTANPEHKGWRPVFELLWVGDPEQRGELRTRCRARVADRKSRTRRLAPHV